MKYIFIVNTESAKGNAMKIIGNIEKICKRDIDNITDWRRYFISIPEIMETLHDYSSYKPNEKFIRFEDDNMSFLEPGYEQRRIDEMNYDIKYD